MDMKKEYNTKQIKEDLYQFEMGNELGAQLERQKEEHAKAYNDNLSSAYKKLQKDNSFNTNKK